MPNRVGVHGPGDVHGVLGAVGERAGVVHARVDRLEDEVDVRVAVPLESLPVHLDEELRGSSAGSSPGSPCRRRGRCAGSRAAGRARRRGPGPGGTGRDRCPGRCRSSADPTSSEVTCTPVSASALASESRSLSVVNHISTASKPAAAAARTRSPASGPASVKSSSMLAESWYMSGVLVGEGGRGRPAGVSGRAARAAAGSRPAGSSRRGAGSGRSRTTIQPS